MSEKPLTPQNREDILRQLIEEAAETLPTMPSGGNSPIKSYDILDLQFARLEGRLVSATEKELKDHLAEMVCWMVIIIEERRSIISAECVSADNCNQVPA